MTIFNFISLFGGLALFLYGMRMMSEGLEHSSSGALKKIMERITNNPFVSFLLGMAVTAIIQSSTATIVLTSGLVSAGIVTLHQSLGIILGANVGTTITGQIIRLLDINASGTSMLNFFKPSTLAPLAAVAGILLIMICKRRSSHNLGSIIMGFGVLFTGLLNMTEAVSPLSESENFAALFMTLADKPFLGFLAGTAAAFTIQSSSATVGILQALSTTGALTFGSVYAVIVGIYLGDCLTTAIVCSIGAKADSKRTGMVHILFNLAQAVLIFAAVNILHKAGILDSIWNKTITSGGIANTHTLFKLSCAIVLLPFCGIFEKLSRRIIKDDPDTGRKVDVELSALDSTLFDSPALALSGAQKVISKIAGLACTNVSNSINLIFNYDEQMIEKINEYETTIDTLTDSVSDYLVRLSPHVTSGANNDRLNYYIKCVSEFERIGDHAVNVSENAMELKDRDTEFPPSAQEELHILQDALDEILYHTCTAFNDFDKTAAFRIEPIEEVIDDLVSALHDNDLIRLRSGVCSIYAGSTFNDLLVNMERIADQCSNLGVHTVSMFDSEVSKLEHDYIRHLHQGYDQEFNRQYAAAREKYYSRLKLEAPDTVSAAD